jgi:Nif-specific ferredoxin III
MGVVPDGVTAASVTRDGRAWQPEFLVAINKDVCIGCGRCFKVCGRHVMTLKGVTEDGVMVDLDEDEDEELEKKVMWLADAGACIGCGACARVCPTNCQTHGATPPPLAA